jgi:hypothetical protein
MKEGWSLERLTFHVSDAENLCEGGKRDAGEERRACGVEMMLQLRLEPWGPTAQV